MKRPLILAFAAGAALLTAGATEAHGVQWSIGINLPPVVYRAPPVVYDAPPVVYEAPPVVYRAPLPAFAPAPVFFERGREVRWSHPGYRHDGRDTRWDERGGRHDRDEREGHRRHHD